MLYNDHFGWPITARSYSSTGTRELIEVSEVVNQMVRRACLFRPAEDQRATASTTTTTTTTTTALNRSLSNRRAQSAEAEKDEVLKEPVVQAAVSYSDLVSLISNFWKDHLDLVSLISNFWNDHKITQQLHSSKMKD